jgi:alternate signal-mediated exported protein
MSEQITKSRTRARSRKSAIVISVALSLVIALAATFAWVTSTVSKVNHFENSGYYVDDGTVVVNETFVPPTSWLIGQTVDKDVSVTNTGGNPALVRVAWEDYLTVLGDNGDITLIETDDSVTSTAGLIKANVDDSLYDGVWDDWTDNVVIDSSLSGYDITALTDLHILKSPTGDTFIAYEEYIDGGITYWQSVKIGQHEVNLSGTTITLFEKLKYAWYTEGTPVYDGWTNSHLNMTWAANGETDTVPALTPTANIGTSQLSDKILFGYNTTNMENGAPDGGKWYYNASDGFFYYVGILAPATTTPSLLKTVTLKNDAGLEFTKVSYDLSVTVQSIQAVKEAVTDAAGWNSLGGNTALVAALEGLF